jgi:putative aldouronate transport system substrate-binding protein
MRFYPGPDGDLVYTYTDERLREYLETMRQWIAEGLIDPDYITTDRDAFDAKVTGNIAGAWEGQIGNKMFEYIELMTPEVPGFELVGAPWPRGEHQVEPYVIPNGYVAKVLSGVAISGQNEHVEESIEWLDYGYGREGHILFNYGIEGESFDYVGDTPVIKDKFFQHPEGLSASQAFAPYYVGFSYPYIHDIEQINQFRPYKAQKEAMRIWTTNVDTSLIFPWLAGFIPSAAEAQEFFDIYGEVNTYTSEMFNKYLLGVESLDSFDEFVETQRRMNIDRAVEIWQLAYERYLSGE